MTDPSHLTQPSGSSVQFPLPAVGFITQARIVPRGEVARSVTKHKLSLIGIINTRKISRIILLCFTYQLTVNPGQPHSIW